MIDGLNPSQERAATHDGGHCLVLAGAGTGKTRTIIARVAHLISTGTPAPRIVVITFTRRAAREIVERVQHQLGKMAEGLRASTFHAFCMTLLRRYGDAFGTKNATVIDPDDVNALFKLVRASLRDKSLPKAAEVVKVYSFARNVSVSIAEACARQELEVDVDAVITLCKAYEQRKKERGYLDYDDILHIVASALERDAKIRELVKRQIDELLVDEMQDSNPLQWRLLDQLRDPARLFCVGDDAQSIYRFRGADIRNILDFTARVPGASVLKLQDNYRSTQELLDLSNWLLDRSPIDYNKRLRATRGQGCKPVLREFWSDWDEADWVADDLQERYRGGAAWHDHMVLVRSAFGGRGIERALLAKEIPYRFIGGVKLLESAHVRDVLAVLRLVANHRDDLAWMRLLQLYPKIGEVTAERIANTFVTMDKLEACIADLRKRATALADAAKLLEAVRQGGDAPATVFKKAAQAMAPMLEIRYRNDAWDQRKRDFAVVEKLASKHDTISGFIEEYLLEPMTLSEVAKLDEDDAVSLITIHSSKGTEKPVCYMPGMNPGMYPHVRALHSEDEIEEERRVTYVAMTRAQDELILTRSVRAFSSEPEAEDAYFLSELPDGLVEIVVDENARGRDFRYSAW
ncbi:ATP-dependent helicase [Aromatoleum evansii]|uniref:ATP-dependent helicase n=1 Tax=Aromatoleum evansii TaxID=59406 RepID=UPI00145D5E3F|nr:ATP-dependent helicase [Aromatoleum evansii]